jgi:SagB-type dehydrogenase family enzyme
MKHHRGMILAAAIAAAAVFSLCRGSLFPADAQKGKSGAQADSKKAGAQTADETVGERFHRETSHSLSGDPAGAFAKKPEKPDAVKSYDKAGVIKLPGADADAGGMTLEQALASRRSVRTYSDEPLTLKQLSRLLFAAQGVTGDASGHGLRTAPSAGATYPFEVYAVVNNVKGLDRGIYHYRVLDHAVELVKEGDYRGRIAKAGLGQDMLAQAAVVFALTAVFDRTRFKYGERGYRYVYMEAGHIAQNLALESVSLGLGSVCAGAFYDDDLNALLGVDGAAEAAIYLEAVGAL